MIGHRCLNIENVDPEVLSDIRCLNLYNTVNRMFNCYDRELKNRIYIQNNIFN